jgi:hypothetical protein
MKRIVWVVVLIAWAAAAGQALAAGQEYKRFKKYVTWSN